MNLSKKFDDCLLNLAWSLWTELGVAGTKRCHQQTLILIEELVLFTSILAEIDPRLRDESLDWCSKFDRFISISRLKSLLKEFGSIVDSPFSLYASTLNALAGSKWPISIPTPPLQIYLSHKSILRPHESRALLNIQARSLFGAGIRADLITFSLVHEGSDFSLSDVAKEMGYSKRSLSEILNDLHYGNLFDRFMQGNQLRFRLHKTSPIFDLLKPIPKYVSWRFIFIVLLSIRNCIQKTKNGSESTKVVLIRNCLNELKNPLNRLGIIPPPFQNDIRAYLEAFSQWILDWTSHLAEGKM